MNWTKIDNNDKIYHQKLTWLFLETFINLGGKSRLAEFAKKRSFLTWSTVSNCHDYYGTSSRRSRFNKILSVKNLTCVALLRGSDHQVVGEHVGLNFLLPHPAPDDERVSEKKISFVSLQHVQHQEIQMLLRLTDIERLKDFWSTSAHWFLGLTLKLNSDKRKQQWSKAALKRRPKQPVIKWHS